MAEPDLKMAEGTGAAVDSYDDDDYVVEEGPKFGGAGTSRPSADKVAPARQDSWMNLGSDSGTEYEDEDGQQRRRPGTRKTVLKVAIAVGAALLLIGLVFLIFYLCSKSRRKFFQKDQNLRLDGCCWW